MQPTNNIYYNVHNNNGDNMKKYLLFIITICAFLPINVFGYSEYIIPGGENIGIKVESDGVLVIGFYKIDNKYNYNNLKIGDYIIKINDEKIDTVNDLVNILSDVKNESSVDLTIRRDGKIKNIKFDIINKNDSIKTGLYVKDSLSGIGTLTYIDPESKIYGALGHEILDGSTNEPLEIKDGKIFRSEITSIDRSVNGTPGVKNAKFYNKDTYGNIKKNTNKGIYGTYNNGISKELMKVGKPDELKTGSATILTVTEDTKIEEYKINITKIDKSNKIKNIYFEITDKKLLESTGGIVQGMSGSPIIQDNKIFGAVTHVVIDNVKSGYGIFITTMLEEGEK